MTMNPRRWALIILLGLLAIAGIGLVLTSEWTNPALRGASGLSRTAAQQPLVDQKPLTTAENLASLAVTNHEKQFADQAIRLADQEVDLAFASALRHAAEHPPAVTPETRQIAARVKQAVEEVSANQREIDRLTQLVSEAHGDRKDAVTRELQMAQARLELAQDDLGDARRDLARAGGDEQARVQRELDEHEKAESHSSAGPGAVAGPGAGQAGSSPSSPRSVIAEVNEWFSRRAQRQQLLQAQQDAHSLAAALVNSHDSLQGELNQPESSKAAPPQQHIASAAATGDDAQTSSVSPVAKQFRVKRQELGDLDQRIDAEQKLDDLYGRWGALVKNRELRALHRVVWSSFWILLIALVAFVGESFIASFLSARAPDPKRLHTVRYVIHFSIRAIALLLILFVVFGPPSQLATVIALAGAGLTVALRDFIVGFFGWFVLIGRNGVRPGDWVEINGVQGKVTDVSLLHTVLLETGNWTAAGHPTGRKVTFVNSYAIEGHYFNFSTAGQWLWDEIQIGLPAVRDPYPVVEAIQKIVVAETEATASLAEQDWQRASTTWGMHAVSSAPEVTVTPTDMGVNVIVRYVTRADERVQLRSRLYRAVFEFLIRKNVLPPDVVSPAPTLPAAKS